MGINVLCMQQKAGCLEKSTLKNGSPPPPTTLKSALPPPPPTFKNVLPPPPMRNKYMQVQLPGPLGQQLKILITFC